MYQHNTCTGPIPIMSTGLSIYTYMHRSHSYVCISAYTSFLCMYISVYTWDQWSHSYVCISIHYTCTSLVPFLRCISIHKYTCTGSIPTYELYTIPMYVSAYINIHVLVPFLRMNQSICILLLLYVSAYINIHVLVPFLPMNCILFLCMYQHT